MAIKEKRNKMSNKMREKGVTYYQTLALEKENSRLSKQITEIKIKLGEKIKELEKQGAEWTAIGVKEALHIVIKITGGE